jgi:hypothetical protein
VHIYIDESMAQGMQYKFTGYDVSILAELHLQHIKSSGFLLARISTEPGFILLKILNTGQSGLGSYKRQFWTST